MLPVKEDDNKLEKPAGNRKDVKVILESTQKVFTSLLDNMPAIVYVADMQTHELLYVNRHAEAIFGSVTGIECWKALQSDQSGPCSFCTNDKLLTRDGLPGDVIHWKFRNTVTNRWYDIRDRAIEWLDGRIVRLEIAVDITQSEESSLLLAESEERFRQIFTRSPDAIFIADPESRVIVDANESAEALLLRPREEIIGLHQSEVHPARFRTYAKEVFENHLRATKSNGKSDYISMSVLRSDGSEVPVHIHASRVTIQKKSMLMGIFRDITDLETINQELRQRERDLAASQQVARIGSWSWDIPHDRITWSDELFDLFGVSPVEFQATFKAFLAMIHPDDRGFLRREMEKSLRDHTRYFVDVRIVNPDGREWVMEARGTCTEDAAGNLVALWGTAQDITERKKTEEELKKHRDHLAELVKERTEEIEEQKRALEQKNQALREIIGQIEIEKDRIKRDVLNNINELVMPTLKKFRGTGNRADECIDLLTKNLEKITSSFGSTITDRRLKLTPREIEVCNMIEKGFTSKEIAGFTNISVQTIEGYRNSIRKKLGIANKKVNLTSYLRSLSDRTHPLPL